MRQWLYFFPLNLSFLCSPCFIIFSRNSWLLAWSLDLGYDDDECSRRRPLTGGWLFGRLPSHYSSFPLRSVLFLLLIVILRSSRFGKVVLVVYTHYAKLHVFVLSSAERLGETGPAETWNWTRSSWCYDVTEVDSCGYIPARVCVCTGVIKNTWYIRPPYARND